MEVLDRSAPWSLRRRQTPGSPPRAPGFAEWSPGQRMFPILDREDHRCAVDQCLNHVHMKRSLQSWNVECIRFSRKVGDGDTKLPQPPARNADFCVSDSQARRCRSIHAINQALVVLFDDFASVGPFPSQLFGFFGQGRGRSANSLTRSNGARNPFTDAMMLPSCSRRSSGIDRPADGVSRRSLARSPARLLSRSVTSSLT